jgi:hypothetical protein
MIMHALVPVLFALALGQPATTTPQNAANPFASVKALSCTFPTYAAAEWAAPPSVKTSQQQDFTFRIDAINVKKRNAQIVGASGTNLATAVLTPTGLNVIEQTPIGNFTLTTVFTAGGKDGAYRAVHSRHLGDVNNPPSVSQSYGSCTIPK